MAIQIPGGDVLGFGFNVYGAYDASSKINPLFNIQYDAKKEWKQGDITYLLPLNASFDPSSTHYGDAYSFSSKEAVEDHFASKVKLSASYGFFSGEFSLDYSQTVKSDTEYSYGLIENFSQFWKLDLQDTSRQALANWVTNDPDFINLPSEYTPANRHLFFRFFDKYGCYFVTGVTVGSRLMYSCSVLKTHKYTEAEIKSKIKLEYDAVFVKVGAEAETEWKHVSEKWSDSRQIHVSAVGGNNTILSALSPAFPDNFHETYLGWLNSAAQTPAVIDFRIANVASLFSGSQAEAVKLAVAEYTRTRLYIESKTGSCLISLNGKELLPQGGGEGSFGFQLAAINRKSLKIAFCKSYSGRDIYQAPKELYHNADADINPYRNDQYIIVYTTWSHFGRLLPLEPFKSFLQNCGAGIGLLLWQNLHDLAKQAPLWYSADITHCNYILIGIPGSAEGEGFEAFGRAGSADTGKPHWHFRDDWYALAAPACSVEVDIFKLQGSEPASIHPTRIRSAHQVADSQAAVDALGEPWQVTAMPSK